MTVDFLSLYEPIKDFIIYLRNRNTLNEIEPIVVSTTDVKGLITNGLLIGKIEDYSFSRPEKIHARVSGPNPSHKEIWVEDKKLKTKRKIVCLNSNGEIDLILVRKLEGD